MMPNTNNNVEKADNDTQIYDMTIDEDEKAEDSQNLDDLDQTTEQEKDHVTEFKAYRSDAKPDQMTEKASDNNAK